MKGIIHKLVESNKKETVSLLQKLVQIPSTTGNKAEIIRFLEKEMKTIGFGRREEKLAHTYEEYVPIEHLQKASEFYTAFMLEYAK